MDDNEQDLIIIRAGYNIAIRDVLDIIDKNIYLDEDNKIILRNHILKKQSQFLLGNTEYEGSLYKYYDIKNQLGYIIFDDIYELKGVCIFIEEGKYIKIDEKELIHIKNNFEIKYFESFKNKDLINLRYEEWISKFEEK